MGRIKKDILYGILLIGIICQAKAVLAGQATQPPWIENLISPLSASILVSEPNYQDRQHAVPGGIIRKDPQITNTGNCDLYVFFEIAVPAKRIQTVEGGRILPAGIRELCTFNPLASWVFLEKREAGQEPSDQSGLFASYIYGYSKILAPGETTEPLFTSLLVADYLEGELEDGELVQVNVQALAIQADYQEAEGLSELWELYQVNKE